MISSRSTSDARSGPAISLSLKAFLIFSGHSVIKKHDLVFLIGQCEKVDLEFSQLLTEAAILTPYDTAYRYPGISSDFEPTKIEAVKDAKHILDFVKRKIGI